MKKQLRGLWRLLVFVLFSVYTVVSIMIVRIFRAGDVQYGLRRRFSWAHTQLRLLGVQMSVEGHPPDFPCLIIANHRSYLDPVLILHDTVAMAVSKAEVASWPLIGAGARASGVIFLKRESPTSRTIALSAIEQCVQDGISVVLFPEGTTHSRPQALPFRRGSFQMAAANGFRIVPVAINYRYAADNWIGDDTFIPHFLRRFGEAQMKVRLAYGPFFTDQDSEALLTGCSEWINARLLQWQEEGWNQ